MSTDSSYQIGHTRAELVLSPQHTGLFRGTLSDEFDKPERVNAMYTGYANIRSRHQLKSFRRTTTYADYEGYNCFLLRLRGDGRTYAFTVSVPQFHSVTHTYMYAYPLYTHGGPYWQTVKIPLSKFFSISHGRLTDPQVRLDLKFAKNFGFSCMDGHAGPFGLELDYLGVLKDNTCQEEIAYETYKTPRYVANS